VSDITDVSFLVETNHLDEKDDTSAKEALFQQQRLQLENEHQKLVDYALDLAKQVHIQFTFLLRQSFQISFYIVYNFYKLYIRIASCYIRCAISLFHLITYLCMFLSFN